MQDTNRLRFNFDILSNIVGISHASHENENVVYAILVPKSSFPARQSECTPIATPSPTKHIDVTVGTLAVQTCHFDLTLGTSPAQG